MAYYNKVRAKARTIVENYKSDIEGSFAVVWTFGITVAIAAVGAGIDIAGASQAKSSTQSMTDQIALAASAFYSTHERVPMSDTEGYQHGHIYSTSNTEFNTPGSFVDAAEGVKYKAEYDEHNGEVTVTAWGKTETALMAMFGKDTIEFKSKSTAQFSTTQLKNPASIALVLDNSRSMLWDDTPSTDCEWVRRSGLWRIECDTPDDAAPRIEGLRDSVNTFMELLESVVGPQSVTGSRVLRTGMIPYSDQIVSANEVEMKWGLINKGDVDDMKPSGATNSAPPIARAWDWLADETAVHVSETGEDNPLRYMIFMTDGQNSGTRTWTNKDDTGLWRGIYCTRRYRCYYTFKASEDKPPNTSSGYNWVEGEYPTATDTASKNSCAAMKAQGVRVFTIGFALEPGTYMTNYTNVNGDDTATITDAVTHSAYSLLADCATAPSDFVTAGNTDSLEKAFEDIGQSIIEDVIRLSQ